MYDKNPVKYLFIKEKKNNFAANIKTDIMITSEQAKQMVKAFVREACKILHMDVESIALEYDVFPQPYASGLAIASPKGILINAIELYKRTEAQSSTPLRICIYHHVRLIHHLRNNHDEESLGCPLEVDAMAFAHALTYLKGLRLDYINFLNKMAYMTECSRFLRMSSG